ncbi:hypothetical protein NQ314_014301 [Rhamnusium bicolor]|uniref:Protein unc-80 homolog n=1 Tax=Rhamnusium bicolor TaxID=1586634 RepID=A0AAV8X378_9CUCU|nr:hypothetical protein NQ314_014301 [Rhamnusium bicolor]
MSQGISASSSEQQHLFTSTATPTTVTITATITKIDDESGWVSSPKDTVFPETIPEESSSTEEEHVVIFRLPSLHESDGFLRDPSIYTAETSIIQLAMRRNGSGRNNNVKAEQIAAGSGSDTKATSKPPMQKIGSSTDKDSVDSSKMPETQSREECKVAQAMDISAATFLDVAVLRCLLRDISDETAGQQQPRKRSNSLPIPKIEVSLYQSTESKKTEKDFIEVPEVKDVSLLAAKRNRRNLSIKGLQVKKIKKRMKIADLKTFVETKLLSKSDKALEKIGQEDHKPLGQHSVGSRRILNDYHRSLDTGDEHLSRPQSAMSKIFEPPSNLVKGKSMPSLSCLIDELNAGGTAIRENASCTLRVLEVILNIVELLLEMGVLKQCLRDEALASSASAPDSSSPGKPSSKLPTSGTHGSLGGEADKSGKPMSSHRLVMNTIVRVLRHLGCPHGCADGQRGPAAEFLRTQCQNILARLSRASGKQFKSFLRDYVKYQTLTDVMDLFHAYVGYCIDPSSLLSPLNQKRGSSKSPDTVSQGGHASNFGAGVGGGGIRGVEGQIMSHVFKPVVTRFVESSKDIKLPENLGLYCEIRQLMTYVKEGHGSIFRRVAMSALIDTADRPTKKEANIQTTRVIRHMHHSEMEDQPDVQTDTQSYTIDDRGVRKLLFKKRSTSSTCAVKTEAEEMTRASQSPLGNLRKKHHILTPRQSERALGISLEPSLSIKSKKSKLGGIVNWFKKGDNSSTDEPDNQENGDSFTDTSSFIRQPSKYYHQKGSGKSNVGQSIQKAKRRMEDKFKFVLKKGKKKDGSQEESAGGYFSRRNSFEFGETSRESEFVVLKERKLVSTSLVYQGVSRLSFLLETCPPGSVPDGHLLASALDLPNSTVVARAALLLECSYFVHCCNKGQWPTWMKLNFPMFRPSGPLPARGNSTGVRRSHIMQRAAGKMFYQWAEVISQRLEEFANEDKNFQAQITAMVTDEQKQKELLIQDEEEDFLDEASINSYGSSCPMPLRLIACILLHEITAFLRETYQTLPKSSRIAGKDRPPPWERLYSREANRRWSMALSSMGHSQTSAQSLQSIAGDRDSGQAERKISFVLHEPDNESEGSSNTTVTMQAMLQGEDGKRIGQPPRPYLLRRGTAAPTGGSFKRRSLKLRRGTKEGKDIDMEWRIPETVKRTDSIQSKRKVSSLSDRSDTSEPGVAGEVSGEESPGVLSDDQPPESPSDSNDTDETTKHMPWMKVMVQVSNSFYYYCPHQNFCHPFCYRRIMRGCSRLIKAVRKVYGEEFGVLDDKLSMDFGGKRKLTRKIRIRIGKFLIKQVLQFLPSEEKTALGKRTNGSQMSKLASKDSSRDIADSDTPCDSKNSSDGKPVEPPSILKYIKTQVKDAFHAPLAVLLKGAVILTEEHFLEIIPVAWELLLESNQEVTACAASIFILGAVKAPQQVSEIMQHGLSHLDCAIRINAILRFQVLWKMRYQAWPRMEESAQMLFKVPPPGIEFTLPSPKIGIESLDVVDSPWELLVKTKVEEVTINQERHRSLVTATKTRKKQQTELIKMALQAQDDKKREERENFLITTIPITIQAAHEPSLYHTSEEHEEVDDEQVEGQPRNTTHHLHSAHSLFPSCLCSAVVQIINLLDDAAVSADGNAVYEVSYQVIWTCLVEDSALFLRYILERLTREKQDLMFKILRHLIRFIPKLPQQAAFALYNYIIGYVMFYVRSPHEDGQQLIGAALSLLWMVVHSVHGIMFKDLKQILRKEQCDASILLTANVPSAKKIIVHGPQDPDAGGIPSQFPVQEDTQFCQILREALDFFGIEENKHTEFFLVDYKTHQIRNPSSYVRDYYFFKRSQYPQLELVHMKPDTAFNALQKQELLHKFVEIGKVLLTWAILKNVDMVVQRVVFLHEELMKLPSFPRKALESDLHLYKSGPLGKELLGLDVLHKFMWVRLIARMFEAMAGNFAYSGDIHLFVNVLNGAVVLHSEDACILRYVMATYINAAFHFKNIFSTNGYLLIMPTLLKIYSNHQTNKLITTTVEYAVKQFYLMNRKPFILQMFGSVSAMLDTDEEGTYGDAHKIILEAILPCYVKQIQLPTYNKEGKMEKEIIHQLAVAIKTLVNNCEALTKSYKLFRSYNGPYRSSPEHKGSSQRNYSRGPYSPGFDFEDDSHSKFMSEHSRAKSMYEHDIEDSEVLRAEYRRPRDVLLSLVGEFMCRATTRLQELNKKNNQDGKVVELLDIKSHVRLADIAHTLLKVSPYDPESMGCRGLQHYMSYILPSTEWANDAMRPALSLIVSDSCITEGVSGATAALMSQAPPPHFCSMVIETVCYQQVPYNVPDFLLFFNQDTCTLEQVCGGSSVFPTQDKTESMILNLIMPLCLRVGTGRIDVAQMKHSDISFALTLVLHAMSPPNTKTMGPSGTNVKPAAEIRTGSLTFTGTRDTKTSAKINTSLYQVSFLALKIMAICFEGELMNEWSRIGRTMRELGKRNEAATFLWDFLDFVVTHRTTLYILMQPFIFQKISREICIQKIRNKMRSIGLPLPKSRGALLLELAHEMKVLKEELDESTESCSEPKKQESTPTCQMTTEIPPQSRHQRHSLIGLFTGEGHHGSKSAPSHEHSHSHIKDRSSQRSSVSDDHGGPLPKSESLMFHKAHKLRFVSSVEFRHSSGETSTTPLSPGSPVDDSSGEIYPNKSRLQRIKPQSRKTFRLRRSRKSSRVEVSHTKLESEATTPSPQHPDFASPPLTPVTTQPTIQQPAEFPVSSLPSQKPEQKVDPLPDSHRLRIATRVKTAEGSWDEDSAMSQTSSISGYRLYIFLIIT